MSKKLTYVKFVSFIKRIQLTLHIKILVQTIIARDIITIITGKWFLLYFTIFDENITNSKKQIPLFTRCLQIYFLNIITKFSEYTTFVFFVCNLGFCRVTQNTLCEFFYFHNHPYCLILCIMSNCTKVHLHENKNDKNVRNP